MSELISVTGRRRKSSPRRRAEKRDRIARMGQMEQAVLSKARGVKEAVKDTDEVQMAFVIVAGALIGMSGLVESTVDMMLGQ